MERVYKYLLPIKDGEIIMEMPSPAEIVHVDSFDSSDFVSLWARVDPNASGIRRRVFHIYGTGHNIDNPRLQFVGTAIDRGLGLVWHVFENAVIV